MLKENSKVKVYICNPQTYPKTGNAIKTRIGGVIFEVKRKNGKMGIDYNIDGIPYVRSGDFFTPFESFSWNVIFEDAETGKQYSYNTITENLEEVKRV